MENESPEVDEYSELVDDILDCDCQAPVNFISNYVFENANGDKAYGAILMLILVWKLRKRNEV